MRKLILFYLLFLSCTIFAQNGIRTSIIPFEREFSIINVPEKGFTTKLIELDKDSFPDLIKHLEIGIRDGDFELTSRLKKLKRKKQKYKPSITIQEITPGRNGTTYSPSSWEHSNEQEVIEKRQRRNTIIWQNATEKIFLPKDSYKLIYTLIKEEELVDCDEDYRFTFKKHTPYLGSALVGGTLLLLSKIHLSKSNDFRTSAMQARADYVRLWESGSAESETTDTFLKNNDDFKESERFYDKYNWESKAGIAIIGAGIVGYITHLIINKRNQNNYKKYCPSNDSAFQLKPVLDPGLTNNLDQQIGLKLTYTFP